MKKKQKTQYLFTLRFLYFNFLPLREVYLSIPAFIGCMHLLIFSLQIAAFINSWNPLAKAAYKFIIEPSAQFT